MIRRCKRATDAILVAELSKFGRQECAISVTPNVVDVIQLEVTMVLEVAGPFLDCTDGFRCRLVMDGDDEDHTREYITYG